MNTQTHKDTDELNHAETDISEASDQIYQYTEVHIWKGSSKPPIETTIRPAKKRGAILGALSLIILCLLIGTGIYLTFPYLFVQNTTITIVPVTRKVMTSNTITIATNGEATGSVRGRALPSITLSQSLTVPATGQTVQSAQPGQGLITFYNSALYSQTIVAGTLITGHSGTQVVTNSAIVVPAGSLATNGQASVMAHTVITGPDGNIPANDVYGSCCLVNIQASNSAFTGGQNAESYSSVEKTDIDTASAKLAPALITSVVAAFQSQVHGDETLVTPPMCLPTVSTDHQVGDRATQVQVSLSETCTGLTYNTQAFDQHIGQIQAVPHYRMLGDPPTTIQSVTTGDNGTYTLTVQSTTTWAYQFTNRELPSMASRIAGKSKSQASSILLHTTGIEHVSFSGDGTLPSDSGRIHFLFLTQ